MSSLVNYANKSLPVIAVKVFVFILVLAALCLIAGCDSKPLQQVYQENFNKPNKLKQRWEVINGQWTVADNAVTGKQSSGWAVMLSRKKLPEDFILTFSACMEPGSTLFEVILGFKEEKYLGVYVYEIENKAAVEDRSLFIGEKAVQERTQIRSTGNIGMLPRQDYQFNNEWMVWKIQKTGSQLFVWINNEPVIGYDDTRGLLESGGRFGFALKGTGQIQNVQLFSTKDEASLPPADFATQSSRKPETRFFLFSE